MSFYTRGNKIFNNKKHPIIVKGVSRSGLEYAYVDIAAMIPETIEFDIRMMKEWGFNAIRFPLRDSFWLSDSEYKRIIKYWVEQTLSNDMFAILDLHTQQDHSGLDPFMLRTDTGVDALSMWIDIAKTYQNHSQVFFEIFNEPHDISPIVWWEGDDTYYGYKEILLAIRQHAMNICLIGGLDYAYQFNFVKLNNTLLHQIKSIPNLVFSVHPYGYKGMPVQNGTSTSPIPTIIIPKPVNHTGDCSLGITVPSVKPSRYGWDESFGFAVRQDLMPVIATEWGLDRPDNCIQGGWYNVEIVEYLNSLGIGYMAWAWVQERLDYPSLLDQDFKPTGIASKPTIGPACSGSFNNFYQGPGVLVQKDLEQWHHHHHQRQLKCVNTNDADLFLPNFLILLSVCGLLLFPFFTFFFRRKASTFQRVVSLSSLKNSYPIKIHSSHSLLEMN